MQQVSTQPPPRLPQSYWWLWSCTLVNSLGAFVVPFLAIYLTTTRHYSVAFAGLALTLFGLGGGLASVGGGMLADRYGRRSVLLASSALSSGSLLALGLAEGKTNILLFTALVGAGLNAAKPARAAMMADLVHPDRLHQAYSLNLWATNLGSAAASAAAGALAEHGFFPLFVINAVASLLCGVLVYVAVPETKPAFHATAGDATPGRATAGPALSAGPRGVPRDAAFLVLLALVFLQGLVFEQPLVSLPITMTQDGLPPSQYGLIMTVNCLTIVFLQAPLTSWARRHRDSVSLVPGLLATGVGLGLTAVVHGFDWFAVSVVLWSLGEIVVWPACMAITSLLAPEGARGRYQGGFTLAWSGSISLAPVLSGNVIQRFGTGAVWLGCVVVALICVAGHVRLARMRDQRAL